MPIIMLINTDRVDEDDVWVVNFPQHLLNASLRTSGSVHSYIAQRQFYTISSSLYTDHRRAQSYVHLEHCVQKVNE